jgi:hypothetical protein
MASAACGGFRPLRGRSGAGHLKGREVNIVITAPSAAAPVPNRTQPPEASPGP